MPEAKPGPVVHDAEYYVLFDQHGDAWAAQDHELDAHLAELESRFGTKPNIVHVMWDDMAFGDARIPALNKVSGFDTPNCNKMAAKGALSTRHYTEPSRWWAACWKRRAARGVLSPRWAMSSLRIRIGRPRTWREAERTVFRPVAVVFGWRAERVLRPCQPGRPLAYGAVTTLQTRSPDA
jgi:arylsulfatase